MALTMFISMMMLFLGFFIAFSEYVATNWLLIIPLWIGVWMALFGGIRR